MSCREEDEDIRVDANTGSCEGSHFVLRKRGAKEESEVPGARLQRRCPRQAKEA